MQAQQKALVDHGLYDQALQMGIDDIRRQNGTIYDQHIREMLESAPRLPNGGIDWSAFKRKA